MKISCFKNNFTQPFCRRRKKDRRMPPLISYGRKNCKKFINFNSGRSSAQTWRKQSYIYDLVHKLEENKATSTHKNEKPYKDFRKSSITIERMFEKIKVVYFWEHY